MQTKASPRLLIMLLAILLLLVLFAFYYLAVIPKQDEVKLRRTELSMTERTLELLNDKLQIEQKKVKDTVSMKDVQAALPLWDNVEQLTLDLDRIKSSSGITFSSIGFSSQETSAAPADPNTPTAANTVKEVKLTLSVIGTYNEIMGAISELQLLPRIITIDTVSWGNFPKDLNRKMSISMALTAYFDPSYRDQVEKLEVPTF